MKESSTSPRPVLHPLVYIYYCSCDLLQGIIAELLVLLIRSSVHPPHSWLGLSKTNLLYLYCIALRASLAGNIFHNLLCLLNASPLQHGTLTTSLPSCATCLHQQLLEAAIRSRTLFRAPGGNRMHLQLLLLHSQCDKCYRCVRSATADPCGAIAKVSLGIRYQWSKNTFEE